MGRGDGSRVGPAQAEGPGTCAHRHPSRWAEGARRHWENEVTQPTASVALAAAGCQALRGEPDGPPRASPCAVGPEGRSGPPERRAPWLGQWRHRPGAGWPGCRGSPQPRPERLRLSEVPLPPASHGQRRRWGFQGVNSASQCHRPGPGAREVQARLALGWVRTGTPSDGPWAPASPSVSRAKFQPGREGKRPVRGHRAHRGHQESVRPRAGPCSNLIPTPSRGPHTGVSGSMAKALGPHAHVCSVDGSAVRVCVLRRRPASWALGACVPPGSSGASAQPSSPRPSQSGPSCCP